VFALPSGVLLIRCASHSRYRGRPRLIGVASWRGWCVQFADGICNRCATRVIDEPSPVPSRTAQGRRGDRAVIFLGLAAFVFAAAPLSEPPLRPIASALPTAVTAASESRGPGTGLQAAMVTPPLVPAVSAAGRGRGVTM